MVNKKFCSKCGKKLIKVGKHLRCKKCDNFCTECGTLIKPDASKCKGCGVEFEGVTSFQEPKKTRKVQEIPDNSDKIFYGVIGAIVFIALILILPTKPINYQIEESYEDIEYYDVKEPYEVEESYDVQKAYESTEIYEDLVPIEKTNYDTQVENADPGNYFTSCGTGCSCSKYESGWFINYCVQCTCVIVENYIVYETIEKERPVTKYYTATETRTVTKYKDVTKSRAVQKTRMVTKQREVNWLFNFEVPYQLRIF